MFGTTKGREGRGDDGITNWGEGPKMDVVLCSTSIGGSKPAGNGIKGVVSFVK